MSDLMELVAECEMLAGAKKVSNEAIETKKLLKALGFNAAFTEVDRELDTNNQLARLAEFKYIVITNNKIKKFLNRKAETYNKTHESVVSLEESVLGMGIGGIGRATAIGTRPFTATQTQMNAVELGERMAHVTDSWMREYAQSVGVSIPMADPFSAMERISTPTIHRNVNTGTGQFAWDEVRVVSYKGIPPLSVLKTMKTHKARGIFDYFTIATVNEIKDPLLLGRINNHADRYFISQWGDDVSLDDLI